MKWGKNQAVLCHFANWFPADHNPAESGRLGDRPLYVLLTVIKHFVT